MIRLHYRDASGNVTTRDVEPVTCLVHREYWYLVGVCRMRRAIRAFRFDRIIAVEPTLTPSRPHLADRFLPFQRRKRPRAA
jgi:proteasome accessory factor B